MDLSDAYRDGRRRMTALVTAPDAQVDVLVPITPEWRVRDVVAHVIGVAEDLLAQSFPDFSDAKRVPEQARVREEWTAAQVHRRRDRSIAELVEEWDEVGTQVEAALATDAADSRYPFPSRVAATFDLASHLHDVRHATGRPGDQDAPLTRVAFALSRGWLDLRLRTAGLPPLRLCAAGRTWDIGGSDPTTAVSAPPFELFRTISGRRSREQILGLDWTGDAEVFLDVLSPYPLPPFAVVE